jgi:hypothetical protein
MSVLVDLTVTIVIARVTAFDSWLNRRLADQLALTGEGALRAVPEKPGIASIANLRDAIVNQPVTVIVDTVALLALKRRYRGIQRRAVRGAAPGTYTCAVLIGVDAEPLPHTDPFLIGPRKQHASLVEGARQSVTARSDTDAVAEIINGQASSTQTLVSVRAGLSVGTNASAPIPAAVQGFSRIA